MNHRGLGRHNANPPVNSQLREPRPTRRTHRLRRYYRRAQRQHLRRLNELQAVERTRRFTANKPKKVRRQEILDIVSRLPPGSNVVFLDLDGTLLPYQLGKRVHRAPILRPFCSELLAALKRRARLFLFSSGPAERTKNLFQKLFREDVDGVLDWTHLHMGKKCLKLFKEAGVRPFILDDNPAAIHAESQAFHVSVPRWFGSLEDRALLAVAREMITKLRR